jgi:multimeric flavodoxin WrbA
MKILGISGSPNEKGNTAYAVQYALDIMQKNSFDTKYLTLAGKEIHPCVGCWKCTKDGKCQFDDYMSEIIEAMKWCNGLIIGSPVYFGLVCGQIKVMMDRSVSVRSYKSAFEMKGKVGAGIACGAFRNGGQELTLQCLHTFLLQQNMMVVSDGFPYSHSGATIVGNTQEDSLGLKTIENLAKNMEVMLKLKA